MLRSVVGFILREIIPAVGKFWSNVFFQPLDAIFVSVCRLKQAFLRCVLVNPRWRASRNMQALLLVALFAFATADPWDGTAVRIFFLSFFSFLSFLFVPSAHSLFSVGFLPRGHA